MVVAKVYDTSKKLEWNTFVDGCKTPLFFFKRDFVEYHASRFTDYSLMFFEDEVLVAILPASKHEKMLVSHGGLTYGGVLLSSKVRSETIAEVFFCLAETARKYGFETIIYKSIPYIFHKQGSQDDLYFIFNQLNGRVVRRDLSSVIYLNDRIKLSKGRKWLIARAKKLDLVVSDSTDWALFHGLLSSVLDKHGAAPTHSVSELEQLYALFPKNIKLKVVGSNEGLLAAVLLFKFDGVVHTQYLATSEQGKECGALDYLLETLIQDSLAEGYTYFSFGISTEEQGKYLNQGLAAQKESFGARGIAIDFYEITLND
ncbi:GNAT family N-acetyltransferase [Pseudomonas sp. MIL19]|uniref:GNAT family N-acetyltransferase n=1 Tax=Pseudomonas sp. MIL19 TaxID=2976979 RepID=UPI0023646078|nr:GNAT family N-acetyltransferase [Pseudomonas sp. MIL19]MDD2162457.1 GNAT family N-acetyltransferase [Pseudomonas sp. MIL19]